MVTETRYNYTYTKSHAPLCSVFCFHFYIVSQPFFLKRPCIVYRSFRDVQNGIQTNRKTFKDLEQTAINRS